MTTKGQLCLHPLLASCLYLFDSCSISDVFLDKPEATCQPIPSLKPVFWARESLFVASQPLGNAPGACQKCSFWLHMMVLTCSLRSIQVC